MKRVYTLAAFGAVAAAVMGAWLGTRVARTYPHHDLSPPLGDHALSGESTRGQEGPTDESTKSRIGPPALRLSEWFDEAASALRSARSYDEWMRSLVAFSSAFMDIQGATGEALARIRTQSGSAEFRGILLLLVAIASDAPDSEEFRRLGLSPEDVVAAAAVRALLLRAANVRACPPRKEWLEAFWGGALTDEDLGSLLGAGVSNPIPPMDSGPQVNGHRSGPTRGGSTVDPWSAARLHTDDERSMVALEGIVVDGTSGVARIIALTELPVSSRTDRVIPRVLEKDTGSSLLRCLAYEHFSSDPINWPIYEKALGTETDQRVLAAVVVFALNVVPPKSSAEWQMIRLAEDLTRRIDMDSQLASRVTGVLSSSETSQGLDALSRLAHLGKNDVIRTAAVCAIGECPRGSPLSMQRVDALLALVADPDPLVAASAASTLLLAESRGVFGDVARVVLDQQARDRMCIVAGDARVPASLRDMLKAQLRAAGYSGPK